MREPTIVGQDARRPALLSVAFWVALVQVVGFFALSWAYAPSAGRVAVHGASIVIVVALWFLLPWSRRASPARKLLPPVFLVASFALGLAGSNGEHLLLPWLAFANLTFVFGVRSAVVALALTATLLGASSVLLFGNALESGIRVGFNVAVIGLFVIAMAMAVDEARLRRAEALELSSKVKSLAAAEERARIARDMHDSLGHQLTVIKIDLENAERLRSRSTEQAWTEVAHAKALTAQALADVRRWVRVLHPITPAGGLTSELLADFARSIAGLGIDIAFDVVGNERELDIESQLVLYRTVQETLTNALKHSGAGSVRIILTFADESVELVAQDDGRSGLAEPATGFGLTSLEERTRNAGGEFQAGPDLDADGAKQGYSVRLRLPAQVS